MTVNQSSWISVPKKLCYWVFMPVTWIFIKALALFVFIFDEDEYTYMAERERNAHEVLDSQEYHDDMAVLQQMNDEE